MMHNTGKKKGLKPKRGLVCGEIIWTQLRETEFGGTSIWLDFEIQQLRVSNLIFYRHIKEWLYIRFGGNEGKFI